MRAPLFEVRDLHVSIGDVEVVSGASLRIESGAAIGLVGETGSGKTMVVRAICGLLGRVNASITQGTISLNGQDVTYASDQTWRQLRGRTIGVVPQSSMSGLDPLMPVGRQLRETIGMLNPGGDRALQAERLLCDVQLKPDKRLLGACAHELSGGMRQRVMIALALAGDPKIVVADEPTTALDVTIQDEILKLLGSLQRERDLGLLLVSHDIGMIESATDEVAVMYAGRTVEAGATRDVLGKPLHPYTEALLNALPSRAEPGELLRTIGGRPPLPGEISQGCPFAPRCPEVRADCETVRPLATEVESAHQVVCLLRQEGGSQ